MKYDKNGNPVIDISFNKLTPKQLKTIKFVVIGVIALIFVVILCATSWYTVNDKQNAVVTTFGKVTRIETEPGMHLKLPFGIQKAKCVDVNIFQKINIGYTTNETGETVSVANESKMITGDFNIVNIDFYIEYKITNPEKYIYASQNPEDIIKNLIQSQVRTVVSSYAVDDVLTVKKAEIQTVAKEMITTELEKYDVGLSLIDVKIQDAEAPTEEVIAAFKSVETAKQGKETALNEAKAYENAKIPTAQAEADKLLQNAEYLKQSRINEAKEQIAMFNAIYTMYQMNPSITKQRMYYEAIEKILPNIELYINTDEDGITKFMPLD
ncbi:MAG: FtsH protease activity modulator HflK [Clostridia bacterium]|nr:FtsH protease activity modulator HflK [Clostridia bacterium]